MDRENGRMRRHPALSAGILAGSVLVSAVLSACGQRGPLYLPTPPAEPPAKAGARTPGTPAPAPPRERTELPSASTPTGAPPPY
jgi:predicted small lipoprotein YifL